MKSGPACPRIDQCAWNLSSNSAPGPMSRLNSVRETTLRRDLLLRRDLVLGFCAGERTSSAGLFLDRAAASSRRSSLLIASIQALLRAFLSAQQQISEGTEWSSKKRHQPWPNMYSARAILNSRERQAPILLYTYHVLTRLDLMPIMSLTLHAVRVLGDQEARGVSWMSQISSGKMPCRQSTSEMGLTW